MKNVTTNGRRRFAGLILLSMLGAAAALAEDAADPALQAKIDEQIKAVQNWAANPVIVNAVKAANANPAAATADMTKEKWKTLTVLDPLVRAFTKNEAAEYLKSQKGEIVAEAFVSAADGSKVAFLAKTTSWSHKGNPKHDVPMSGKTWQGAAEVDESTGTKQIQVSVPVLDGSQPIGSLVVGLNIGKLSGN